MSTANPELSTSSRSDKYISNWKLIAIPYAIAILAQVPMLLLYFRNLSIEKPHYQTAPFAFLATIVIAYFRWPKEAKMPFHRSILSDLLLALGVVFAIVCVLFAWPSAAAGSVMLLIASLLARTVDKETLKSLWPAALPMFVYLTLPSGYDIQLITWLQRISAVCTSRLLDLYGLGHFMDGTVIQVPGHEPYGIEAACSGVQSFFTLMFIAVLFIVIYRRPFFRSALLIASAVFWALFMNTIRIFLIPVLDQFDVDVAHGFPHALLGWATLAVGVLLLLSTDQFMTFLFGPVDPEVGKSGPFGKLVTKAWNGLISGEPEETKKKRKKVRKPITNGGKVAIWALCGILALAGLWSSFDVAYSFTTAPDYIRFFDSDVTRSFEENDLPETIDQWTAIKGGHSIDIRERGSDLGRRSDLWRYQGSQFAAIVSIDQPFPGWHELTTCYKNSGWELVGRVRRDASAPGVDSTATAKWPYVVAEFKRETGERGFLTFAMFNSVGEPVNPPAQWNRMIHLFSGIGNRMSNRVRASLFDNSTYQVQAFVTSYGGGLGNEAQKEVESHFLKIREILKDKFVAKTGGVVEAPDATAAVN
jgi:exosortase